MLTRKQIERARNLLTTVLVHDATDQEPLIFTDKMQGFDAVFSAGVLYWLFEDDPHPGVCTCPEHESSDFQGFLDVMKMRLKEAGYADPESDEVYRLIKKRMEKLNTSLYGALYDLKYETSRREV